MSRTNGFSKGTLSATLTKGGLSYHHLKDLGAPKPLRQALAAQNDFVAFARSYRSHLRRQKAALDELLRLVRSRRVCVLCVEANPDQCHRSLLAEHVRADSGIEVIHLN